MHGIYSPNHFRKTGTKGEKPKYSKRFKELGRTLFGS